MHGSDFFSFNQSLGRPCLRLSVNLRDQPLGAQYLSALDYIIARLHPAEVEVSTNWGCFGEVNSPRNVNYFRNNYRLNGAIADCENS